MPIIVRHMSTPVTMWPTANHHPAISIQMTFPMIDMTPASVRRIAVRPNGHSAYPAIRNAAIPNGIVIIRMMQTIPAIT